MRCGAMLLLFVTPFLVWGDEKQLADQLEKRGMTLKREKSAVTEISFASTVTMKGEDYQVFREFPQLRRLWMAPSGTPLNDETVKELGTLPSVETFFYGTPRFTDDGLKAFAGWKNLKSFGLDHWFGPVDSKAFYGKGLIHLKDLPRLESVRLGGCRVDNEAPKALAHIKSLQKVDLFHTFAVTDDGIAALQALPNLKTIILGPQYTPRITNGTLKHLGGIPTLEEISITETWFTYANGFEHLKKLPNLKSLKLKYVLADEKDMARLKAEMPRVALEWSLPDEMNTAKLRRTFKAYWEAAK